MDTPVFHSIQGLSHCYVTGMNIGAATMLLLVSPITSWGTVLVMRQESRLLIVYNKDI
jgi:hypothetical protein